MPTPAGLALKAPAFIGDFWGKEREVHEGGPTGPIKKVNFDEAYFMESVEKPMAKIVKGAIPAMAPLPTTLEERKALAAYVKSLSTGNAKPKPNTPDGGLGETLKGKRIYLDLKKGDDIWMEFHPDGNVYAGEDDDYHGKPAKWSVEGNKVKILTGNDDDYMVFKDTSLTVGSTIIGLNAPNKTEDEGEKTKIKDVKTRNPSELAEVAPTIQLIQGFINAMAARDYKAFKKLTCLGMTKEQFKAFMAQNDDRKVTRAWDVSKDDFVPGLNTIIQEAFRKAQEKRFDWSRAKIVDFEIHDDGKAELISGEEKLHLFFDDCFLTPQGKLMFDVPSVR